MTKEDAVLGSGVLFFVLSIVMVLCVPFGGPPTWLMSSWAISFIIFLCSVAVTFP